MSLLSSLIGALVPKKKSKKKQTSKKSTTTKPAKPSAKKSASSPTQISQKSVSVTYRIPAQLTDQQRVEQSTRTWHPPGRAVKVAGRTIHDGMIYVGSPIESISGWRGTEPALIDPALSVASKNPDTAGMYLDYWPSYSALHESTRAAYLDWLAAGRPAGAPIGYVFLFFYGIERRILFDANSNQAAKAEIPHLIAEVERLLQLYPEERSFQSYATDFVATALLKRGPIDPRQIVPPLPKSSWELPLSARLALGTFAAWRQPVPPIWAMSWLYCDPETRLRTPAKRCHREFMTLFRLAYQQQFGPGMIIDSPRARLTATYRPASASFAGAIPLEAAGLPDVAQLRKPQSQLRAIADNVTEQLEAYSRAIGSGSSGTSLSALAYLPEQLGKIAQFPSVAPYAAFLNSSLDENGLGTVKVERLLAFFPEYGARPSQKQVNALSQLTSRIGFGLEPDPVIDRRAFVDSERVGLFRRMESTTGLPRDLAGPKSMLSLCMLVAAADGAVSNDEQAAIFGHVVRAYRLNQEDQRRLHAYLAWLADRPQSLASARKRLHLLPADQAALTGRFLVSIAAIDGRIEPAEVRLLTRLYSEMGLDEQQLHTDLHGLATARSTTQGRDARPRIPSSGSQTGTPSTSIALDPAFVQQVQQETTDIAGILDQVFADDSVQESTIIEPEDAVESDEDAPVDPYIALVELLSSRPTWSIAEVRDMAVSLQLMGSGAIETINQRADMLGLDPLIECDDTICDLDAATLKELLAHG